MANWRDEWPMHDVGLVLGLAAAGLSATEIGRRMDRSRNAVIGKVHRMGGRLCAEKAGTRGSGTRAKRSFDWDETRLTQKWSRRARQQGGESV